MKMQDDKKNEDICESTENRSGRLTGLLDRTSITACVLGACVALVCSFTVLKIGINYHSEKIDLLSSNIANIEARLKIVDGLISTVESEIDKINKDSKSNKENLSYLYSGVASLQKEIGIVKGVLNLQQNDNDDSVNGLPPNERQFIESLESLIKDGAPIDGLIASHSDKIDMDNYACSRKLNEYSKEATKSLDVIKKDFIIIGKLLFNIELAESFWARQKRLVREKIASMIKIHDKDAEKVSEEVTDDKALFEMAFDRLSKEDAVQCLVYLEKIKMDDEKLNSLISDVRKRIDLDLAFTEFKNEFILAASKDKRTSSPAP
jgi:hypothetical protein